MSIDWCAGNPHNTIHFVNNRCNCVLEAGSNTAAEHFDKRASAKHENYEIALEHATQGDQSRRWVLEVGEHKYVHVWLSDNVQSDEDAGGNGEEDVDTVDFTSVAECLLTTYHPLQGHSELVAFLKKVAELVAFQNGKNKDSDRYNYSPYP